MVQCHWSRRRFRKGWNKEGGAVHGCRKKAGSPTTWWGFEGALDEKCSSFFKTNFAYLVRMLDIYLFIHCRFDSKGLKVYAGKKAFLVPFCYFTPPFCRSISTRGFTFNRWAVSALQKLSGFLGIRLPGGYIDQWAPFLCPKNPQEKALRLYNRGVFGVLKIAIFEGQDSYGGMRFFQEANKSRLKSQ